MPTDNGSVSSDRQFRLLIAGSMKASPLMMTKAHQAVEKAKANGWVVLVGTPVALLAINVWINGSMPRMLSGILCRAAVVWIASVAFAIIATYWHRRSK